MHGAEGGSGGLIDINHHDFSGKNKEKMLILQARAKSTLAHTEPPFQMTRGDSNKVDLPSFTIGATPY